MSVLRSQSTGTDDHADEREDHAAHASQLAAAVIDPAAFAPLYARYKADIYRFCYRRLGHAEEAADATSQVFVKVLHALPTYRISPDHAGSAFRAWLYTIAETTLVDLYRRRRPTEALNDDWTTIGSLQVGGEAPSMERELMADEDVAFVRTLLRRLPDRQRRIMELRLAELSGQEIAETLNISLSAVKSAQFRAVRTLRRHLGEIDAVSGEGRRG